LTFDPADAARIREILAERNDIAERKMMGGVCFMVGGAMCAAASFDGGILVRIRPEHRAAMLARDHVGPMEMGARTMQGFVRVAPPAYATDAALRAWIGQGIAAAAAMPAKAPRKPPRA
jgi:TfoX/Sxy family transcriptional regulator of competence genes